jgi:hypothetical protein
MPLFTCKSTKHKWKAEITYVRPNAVSDIKWNDLVGNADADINTLAMKAWTVEAQRVCRDERTPEAAQAKLDAWRYKGGSTPTVMDLQGMTFSQAQLDTLLKSGAKLVNFIIKK